MQHSISKKLHTLLVKVRSAPFFSTMRPRRPATFKLLLVAAAALAMVHAAPPDPPAPPTTIAGDGRIAVLFAPPANDNGKPITSYTIQSSPSSTTVHVGPNARKVLLDVINDVAYTCTVIATNGAGDSIPSTPSAAVTPSATQSLNSPTPVFSHTSDSDNVYIDIQTIPSGAPVVTTTDGTAPTCGSTPTTPDSQDRIRVTVGAHLGSGTFVKALSCVAGKQPSEIVSSLVVPKGATHVVTISTSSTTLPADGLSYVHVQHEGKLEITSDSEASPLLLASTVHINIDGKVSADSLDIRSPTIVVTDRGLISARGRGFQGATKISAKANQFGNGPGGGFGSKGDPRGTGQENGIACGGGHGGIGGGFPNFHINPQASYSNDVVVVEGTDDPGTDNVNQRGRAYGNFRAPIRWGSSGGRGGSPSLKSPNGGGRLHLMCTGSCTINGEIDDDADPPVESNGGVGGSAGGSIWLETRVVFGTGRIHANGGKGWRKRHGSGGRNSPQAAGGAGGRVAVSCSHASFSRNIKLEAFGASYDDPEYNVNQDPKHLLGGAGTVYISDIDHPYGELIIDNNNNDERGLGTPQPTVIFGAKKSKISNITVQGRSNFVVAIPTTISDGLLRVTESLQGSTNSRMEIPKDMTLNFPSGGIFFVPTGFRLVVAGGGSLTSLDMLVVENQGAVEIVATREMASFQSLHIRAGGTMNIQYDLSGKSCTNAQLSRTTEETCGAYLELIARDIIVAGRLIVKGYTTAADIAMPLRLNVSDTIEIEPAGQLMVESGSEAMPVVVRAATLKVSGEFVGDSLKIIARQVTVAETGSINADGNGFPGIVTTLNTRGQAELYQGNGPGGGYGYKEYQGQENGIASGAGHGGVGGGWGNLHVLDFSAPHTGTGTPVVIVDGDVVETGATKRGRAYGDFRKPVRWGSSGGRAGTFSKTSSSGGGRIHVVADSMTILGVISSNSQEPQKGLWTNRNGDQAAGGGAGGSIFLEVTTLIGTGTIQANGGEGYAKRQSHMARACGGGGGRVAVITPNQFPSTITLEAFGATYLAEGNAAPANTAETWKQQIPGGAGTVFIQDQSRPLGSLIIKNNLDALDPTTTQDMPNPTPLFDPKVVVNTTLYGSFYVTQSSSATAVVIGSRTNPKFTGYTPPVGQGT